MSLANYLVLGAWSVTWPSTSCLCVNSCMKYFTIQIAYICKFVMRSIMFIFCLYTRYYALFKCYLTEVDNITIYIYIMKIDLISFWESWLIWLVSMYGSCYRFQYLFCWHYSLTDRLTQRRRALGDDGCVHLNIFWLTLAIIIIIASRLHGNGPSPTVSHGSRRKILSSHFFSVFIIYLLENLWY